MVRKRGEISSVDKQISRASRLSSRASNATLDLHPAAERPQRRHVWEILRFPLVLRLSLRSRLDRQTCCPERPPGVDDSQQCENPLFDLSSPPLFWQAPSFHAVQTRISCILSIRMINETWISKVVLSRQFEFEWCECFESRDAVQVGCQWVNSSLKNSPRIKYFFLDRIRTLQLNEIALRRDASCSASLRFKMSTVKI